MDSARKVTVAVLRDMFDSTERLDECLSVSSKSTVMSHLIAVFGRLAKEMLKELTWYEGVELSNWNKIERSSMDIAKRRLMVTEPRGKPIMAGLFAYCLDKRKLVKERMRQRITSGGDHVAIRSDDYIQNMYKTVANSLYGYVNYSRGILYSPPAAAAITLFSRKIFAETTYLYKRKAAEPRVSPRRATTRRGSLSIAIPTVSWYPFTSVCRSRRLQF